jgi:hypothetical protein
MAWLPIGGVRRILHQAIQNTAVLCGVPLPLAACRDAAAENADKSECHTLSIHGKLPILLIKYDL